MIDRFTEKAKDAIGLAADAAESLGHHYVGTEHLLIGLIQEGTAERSTYTPGARKVIENSYREAVRFKAPLIGTEHILIAMIKENDCVASRLLNTMGVSIQKLYLDLLNAMGEDVSAGGKEEFQQSARTKGKGTPTLDSYSRDGAGKRWEAGSGDRKRAGDSAGDPDPEPQD